MRFSFIGVLGLVGVLGDCQTRSGVILGYGNDISSSKVASQGDCCNKCNEAAECATWTFHTDGSDECWLHRVGNTTEQRSNVISGYRDGPAPPSSPWHACTGPKADTFKYCDTSLSLEARLDDLISRISLLDAGAQLTARESPQLPAIELPAYYWGTNAIHGLQNLACLKDGKCPTSFPAPCSLSASFNDTIVQSMGHVLGVELRAYFNAEAWDSLDTWSPTINLNRDPRWGRNVESPGEDPLVCGRYGTAYSLGLQDGLDPTVRMATVTLKHWIAYSIESYNGVTRHNVDVNVSAYDLANSYFPAWEKTVKEGGARGVMCSYNMLNGKPTCGNPELTAILRSDWGFKGYITSDSDSCSDIYKSHKFEPTIELATRDCLESGTDIDSGSTYKNGIESAVSQKIVNQSFVNQALRNSYRMRFEMGLFDPKIPNKYRDIKTDVVGSIPHQELSLHAARQGMVLLKNDGKTLPFSTGKNIAVIGQAVNDTASYTGNYDGPLCPHGGASCFPTIFEQVRDQNTGGVTTMSNSVKDVAGATKNVKEADLCVLVIDNAKDGGGEGHDRHTISLSDEQLVLANAVLAVGKPTVLVMINGGMISLDKLAESAPAILEAFMPGVHGAEAIADTIFGRNNPGGKLPVTMYPSDYIDKVDFLSMDMNNGKCVDLFLHPVVWIL